MPEEYSDANSYLIQNSQRLHQKVTFSLLILKATGLMNIQRLFFNEDLPPQRLRKRRDLRQYS